jgi:hypothetical protein
VSAYLDHLDACPHCRSDPNELFGLCPVGVQLAEEAVAAAMPLRAQDCAKDGEPPLHQALWDSIQARRAQELREIAIRLRKLGCEELSRAVNQAAVEIETFIKTMAGAG